jgi:hypothetical protein
MYQFVLFLIVIILDILFICVMGLCVIIDACMSRFLNFSILNM